MWSWPLHGGMFAFIRDAGVSTFRAWQKEAHPTLRFSFLQSIIYLTAVVFINVEIQSLAVLQSLQWILFSL